MINDFILERVEKLKKEKGIISIAVTGSYARNEEEKYSDIDILCIKKRKKASKIETIDGKYFVISYHTEKEIEDIFNTPNKASRYLYGLKSSTILFDSDNYFNKIKERAKAFSWTESLIKKRDQYINDEFIGWLEEINKSTQGLLTNDIGKMIMGLHGLTFGMFDIISIYKEILIKSDNTYFTQIVESMNDNDDFVRNSYIAFGIEKNNGVGERTKAGLEVFFHTFNEVKSVLSSKNRKIILKEIDEIRKDLNYKI